MRWKPCSLASLHNLPYCYSATCNAPAKKKEKEGGDQILRGHMCDPTYPFAPHHSFVKYLFSLIARPDTHPLLFFSFFFLAGALHYYSNFLLWCVVRTVTSHKFLLPNLTFGHKSNHPPSPPPFLKKSATSPPSSVDAISCHLSTPSIFLELNPASIATLMRNYEVLMVDKWRGPLFH